MSDELELQEAPLGESPAGAQPESVPQAPPIHEGDPERDAGGHRGQPRQFNSERFIPKYRFDEVNQRYAAYRPFGKPEEIKAKLERLAELEKQPQNRYDASQANRIREEFLHLFPFMRTMEQTHEVQSTTFLSHGQKQNAAYAKELGMEVNDASARFIENMLAGVIRDSPELAPRFFARDPSVFADAFKLAKQMFPGMSRRTVPGLQQAQNKTPLRAQAPTKTQAPVPEKPKPKPGTPLYERDVLDEAAEEAFARISEHME